MPKRLVRWLGYAGGTLVALLIVAVCAIYAWSGPRFVRKYTLPPERAEVTHDSAMTARGRPLATAVLDCTGCHGEDLGGNVMFDVPPVARLVALNLTSGANGAARGTVVVDWATRPAALSHGRREAPFRGTGRS